MEMEQENNKIMNENSLKYEIKLNRFSYSISSTELGQRLQKLVRSFEYSWQYELSFTKSTGLFEPTQA